MLESNGLRLWLWVASRRHALSGRDALLATLAYLEQEVMLIVQALLAGKRDLDIEALRAQVEKLREAHDKARGKDKLNIHEDL